MSRLLFVVNDAPFFISHRLPLALGAKAAGFEVHVATPSHVRQSELSELGFGFHPIPLNRSGASPLAEGRSFLALLNLYRALRPDLVHHVTHKPVLYGSLAARLAGVPAVVNAISGLGYAFVAEGWLAERRRHLMMFLYRVALRHPRSTVIFQNREDIALFKAAGAVRDNQVVLIPGSGVDLERFVPAPEPAGPPVVVLPARMLWDKGVGDFVAASRLLKQRGVLFRAILVGAPDPGNPRSITPGQLTEWAAEGIVEWSGFRADMPRVFADCHVVCLPSSYREGVPKALLEAAAAGRPVVTTEVPGCRDVVTSGENGLVVPPRNPAALADALEMLIANADLRVVFGSQSRVRAERDFGEAAVINATLRLYQTLLSS